MSHLADRNHTATLKWNAPNGEALIAELARVSNPANQNNEATAPRLISYLIRNQHWSPFEMVSMTIDIMTTRDIGRQILRHKSAVGFQELSGRYAAVGELLTTRECRFQDPTNRQSSLQPMTDEEKTTAADWDHFIAAKAAKDQQDYDYWLSRGVAKECARAILPEGLVPTRMYFHGSIRTWIHYTQERCKPGVQREHRLIAEQCSAILEAEYPSVVAALALLWSEFTYPA